MSSENGFSWRYGYDIGIQDNQIIVRVEVNLVPGDGVKKIALDRVIPGWEKEIEHIWSRKFGIQTQTGQLYPIVVDAAFKGRRFHHDVIVKPGGGCCTDQLNWHILDTPMAIAHEFGHMLGNYDEYRRGALDPGTKIIDPTSIMTSKPKNGIAYPRHFQRVLDWFKEKNGSDNMMLLTLHQEPSK
ncbi:MAG: hypothetical protein QNK40_14970 [Desulfobacterales bacterium]|nr:hypothetical protein [Desulfobacterales bacterium]